MDDLGSNINIEKSIKKAQRKAYSKMVGLTIFVCWLVVLSISLLRLGVIQNRVVPYARMQGDLTVFTSLGTYGGYGTNLSPYKPEITVYGYLYNGFSFVDTSWNTKVEITPITLKMRYYDGVGSGFSYGEERNEDSLDATMNVLKHNPNNVASMFLTLDKIYDVKELKYIEETYNVKVIWIALETGNEYRLPDHITMGNTGPLRMFGIPTTFTVLETRLEGFKTYQLDFSNVDEYMSVIQDELTWSLNHRNYIAKDQELIVFDDMKQVLSKGMNVYGTFVIGPTDELIKLCEDKMVTSGNVAHVYPWDWSVIK